MMTIWVQSCDMSVVLFCATIPVEGDCYSVDVILLKSDFTITPTADGMIGIDVVTWTTSNYSDIKVANKCCLCQPAIWKKHRELGFGQVIAIFRMSQSCLCKHRTPVSFLQYQVEVSIIPNRAGSFDISSKHLHQINENLAWSLWECWYYDVSNVL